ncbi:cellulose binding domain-containing protein [Streptacidiphilus griseoplanus]|uniref:cellulose binding domain-containing protein n=1 Tax=Peterkaempfera griseoplana TaxID=66896 RepID=UPI0006E2EEBD|nr:cellulose binding domain-containing protein [Peterkaempfera griseoplana]
MRHQFTSGLSRAVAFFTVAGLFMGAALAMPSSSAAADTSTKYLGIFRETSPTDVPSGTVSRYGVTPASVQWFDNWASGNAFGVANAQALWKQGIMPDFTWEPWNPALGVNDTGQIHLQDIIGGKWDSYIKARGAEFASAGVPIMVRWGHEFNGNWYPWGIVNNSSDPSLYVRAYRHVHDLVAAAGATNVQWVWCFNNSSTPSAAYNDPGQSYPGDSYVDWVAIDGYNWGLAPSWDPSGNYWTSFDSAFSNAYAQARAIAPHRPVMLAEVGSSEDGGNKAQWINDMSTTLQSGRYADLKLISYFDQDKEELWSGTSSPATQTAFTSWVNQPYMKGKGTDLAGVAGQYEGTTSPSPTPTPTTPPTTPPTSACSATYRTISSWPGGFQGEVTVSAGAAGTSGWTARWPLTSGQTISQLWNGTLTVDASTAVVKNLSWNGTLGANGSTTFGFTATGSPATPAVTCASP